jgi:hypothetical protein
MSVTFAKYGVSYNVFDGEELLESSIKSIRDNVDFVSVVYQTVSNFGNPCSEELVPLLEKLKSEGLIDELFEYNPKINKGGHYNEIRKRNIGLILSEGASCTHHMAMDSDEFYTDEQMKFVQKSLSEEFIDGDGNPQKWDSSACQMVTYYKEPNYRLEPKEEYYVSLFHRIRPNIEYVMGHQFPVLVDPTRRVNPGNCRIFTRDEVEMHHMSYIRKNMYKKLQNSSASPNFKNIDRIVDYYESWEFPKQGLMGGAPDKFYDIVEVDKLFNTWE